MDKKVKARWIKALRSGKYPQGQGYLFKDNKFCCLGVLCDVENRIDLTVSDMPNWDFDVGFLDGTTDGKEFMKEIGLSRKIMNILILMNDSSSEGLNFNEIADWIEKNL